MRITLFCVVVVLASIAYQVAAEDRIAIYGVGNDSCGKLVQAYRGDHPTIAYQNKGRILHPESKIYSEWLYGYFSAYNEYASKTGDFTGGVDGQGLSEWVRSYCEKNPTHRVERAASECINAVTVKK
jgi:hypothetical protein